MTFRPVTIEDGRVVEPRPEERDEEGRFKTFRAFAESLSGETGFAGPHGMYIRACAAADESIATLRSRLATAEAALADRDRHFLWDERLRMEREIGDLATRLATAEAERDRWQARAEWLSTASDMEEPGSLPATPDHPAGWHILGVPGFYATRWEAIDAACSTIPSHTPNKET